MPRRLLSDDRAVLTIIVTASMVVHGVAMISGLGEQDSARILNDAFIWRDNPSYLSLPEVGYRPRVLPLSLIILRSVLQAGVPMSALPHIMNVTNVVVGAFSLVPLFLIWRRIAGRQAAYIALAFASVMPAFWLANIYGYPHLIGFALFLASLQCFLTALDHEGHSFLLWNVLSGFLLAVGIGIKADMILGGGAFFGALWFFRRIAPRTVVAALAIIALTVTLAWSLHEFIASSAIDSVDYAAKWHRQFPISLKETFSPHNIIVNYRASGFVLSLIILISGLELLRKSEDRRVLIFFCAWVLPIILFWDLRPGNSARHLMAAVVPTALLPAIVMQRIFGHFVACAIVAASVIAANYALSTPTISTVLPSARLLASRDLIEAWVNRLEREAASLVADKPPKLFLVGFWKNPYVTYQILKNAQSVRQVGEGEFVLHFPDGTTQIFARAYSGNREERRRLAAVKASEGYRVVSLETDVAGSASPAKSSR